MTSNDPIAAILDQLAAHREQLTHLSRMLDDHAAVLTELVGAAPTAASADGYHPEPAAQWHTLPPGERIEHVARLRAWVEQVYRPGYGHLAASLAPCWEAHDLCLYGLDIAASLWSVLYLQPLRTPGLISAQAEFQSRILPALAEQFRIETTWCGHSCGPAPAGGRP